MDYTKIIWVDNEEYADAIFCDNSKVKLFYNEANKYRCFAENWGKSKGIDSFQDVCIVLNATTLNAYHQKKLHMLAPSTLNKLYVAFTRAKGDIYLVPHVFTDKFKL